jgi:hypothetical protein
MDHAYADPPKPQYADEKTAPEPPFGIECEQKVEKQ